MLRELAGPWRQYLRADFHPRQQDDRLAREWLAASTGGWRTVGV